jgi:hypothetical protein
MYIYIYIYLFIYISLIKQQFFVTHTIRRTEIPALPYSWVTSTPSNKMMCPQKIRLSLYFRKNLTCFSVSLLRLVQVCSFSFKTVIRWDTTNFCSMSECIALKCASWLLQDGAHTAQYLCLNLSVKAYMENNLIPIQVSGGETWGKETAWKTQASMGG